MKGDDHALHDHAQERSATPKPASRPRWSSSTRWARSSASYAQAGRFLDGAGLGGSKTRTRLVFRDGHCTVKHGPYRGEHELPAATLLLKVRTREEAIGWAERYGKILGDGEIELGKVNEPWDIGLMPAPENPPLQMLLIEKADQATEAGGRSTKQKADAHAPQDRDDQGRRARPLAQAASRAPRPSASCSRTTTCA